MKNTFMIRFRHERSDYMRVCTCMYAGKQRMSRLHKHNFC